MFSDSVQLPLQTPMEQSYSLEFLPLGSCLLVCQSSSRGRDQVQSNYLMESNQLPKRALSPITWYKQEKPYDIFAMAMESLNLA